MAETELTVAQAAARLGTTIPRLRRLLARPEFADCARQERLQTLRGTRTSTVVPVSELPRMAAALKMGNATEGVQERKQERSKTFSEMEVIAIQTTLRRTEELLHSKDRELAAKDEIIGLLREKVERLEKTAISSPSIQEQEQERPVPGVAAETPPPPAPEPQDLATGGAQAGAEAQAGAQTPPEPAPGITAKKRPNLFERWLSWLRE